MNDYWTTAPGDLALEIRVVSPGTLVAWDPNANNVVAMTPMDESNDPNEAFRRALLKLADKVGRNDSYINGEG